MIGLKRQYVSILLLAIFNYLGMCTAFSVSPKTPSRRSSSTQIAASSERVPWDVLRFVKQSSRFVEIFPRSKTVDKVVQAGDSLWKAGQLQSDFSFAPLDDVVMGGASSSSFDGATGLWKGQVTDSNNGGFVGIRSAPFVNLNMSNCKGIKIKITSKSQSRLKVVVRDSTEFNGVGWTTSVNLGKGRTIVDIPFAKQVPTKFAKTVSGETFDNENVKGFQFVYSKFEYDGALNPRFKVGDIDLQVEEITAY